MTLKRIKYIEVAEREQIIQQQLEKGYILSKEENIEEGNFLYFLSADYKEEPTPFEQLGQRVNELETLNVGNMLAVTEVYEETISRENENVETMLGLTEAYEYISILEERIMALEAKLNG